MGYKKYAVDEKLFKDLIYSFIKLTALENGGVDNWDCYREALGDFLEVVDCELLSEAADQALQEYIEAGLVNKLEYVD